jgi:hypothetical protein
MEQSSVVDFLPISAKVLGIRMNVLKDSSRKRTTVSLAVALLLAMSMTMAFALRPSYAATTTIDSGVVIPLYNYPDSTWTTIAQTAQANPNVPIIAVINPNNGPGSSEDPTYLAGVQSLQAAGVKVLGYVATGYATSSYSALSSVESLANDYKVWYNVNGIFFDEMSNVATYESYYSTLNSYVKSDGMTYTMGNPGTSVPDSYIGILNNLVIDENQGYPSLSFITYPGYPASDFSFIAYGVSYNAAFVTSAASLVGYMYIDNLSGGNPYSTLSSLFAQTVATLAAIDGTQTSSTTSSTSTSTTSTTSTSSTSTAGSSQLTVTSQNSAGATITGFWTVLYDHTGAVSASGYTPITYSLSDGQAYSVEADSYGSCTFSHWQDNGSTADPRSISISSNTNLVAIYDCGTSTTTSTTTTTTTTTTSTTKQSPISIKVRSSLAGSLFTGMYVTIQSSSGALLASGYTTFTFRGVSGTTYVVCADNYLTTVFAHWSNGNTNSCQTVTPTSSLTMTAYYTSS